MNFYSTSHRQTLLLWFHLSDFEQKKRYATMFFLLFSDVWVDFHSFFFFFIHHKIERRIKWTKNKNYCYEGYNLAVWIYRERIKILCILLHFRIRRKKMRNENFGFRCCSHHSPQFSEIRIQHLFSVHFTLWFCYIFKILIIPALDLFHFISLSLSLFLTNFFIFIFQKKRQTLRYKLWIHFPENNEKRAKNIKMDLSYKTKSKKKKDKKRDNIIAVNVHTWTDIYLIKKKKSCSQRQITLIQKSDKNSSPKNIRIFFLFFLFGSVAFCIENFLKRKMEKLFFLFFLFFLNIIKLYSFKFNGLISPFDSILLMWFMREKCIIFLVFFFPNQKPVTEKKKRKW